MSCLSSPFLNSERVNDAFPRGPKRLVRSTIVSFQNLSSFPKLEPMSTFGSHRINFCEDSTESNVPALLSTGPRWELQKGFAILLCPLSHAHFNPPPSSIQGTHTLPRALILREGPRRLTCRVTLSSACCAGRRLGADVPGGWFSWSLSDNMHRCCLLGDSSLIVSGFYSF